MTIVVREALAGARRRARDELAPEPCPACERVASGAQRALRLVLDGLESPAEADLYLRHDGICLPHFLHAAPLLGRSTLKPLAEHLIRGLTETTDSRLLALLAGADDDARRRGQWRDRLPEPATAGTTLEQLCGRLSSKPARPVWRRDWGSGGFCGGTSSGRPRTTLRCATTRGSCAPGICTIWPAPTPLWSHRRSSTNARAGSASSSVCSVVWKRRRSPHVADDGSR